MYRDANGPLYEFLKEIGRDMGDCGKETPINHFSETVRDVSTSLDTTNNWMLVHLNEAAKRDFDLIEKGTTKPSIVHCPRSHAYFRHSPFQFEKLRKLGANVCLGTDSLASNDDLSLFAEMRAFQKEFPNIAPEEILEMVTVKSACALRQTEVIGKIRAGFAADLIAISIAGLTSIFEQIPASDRPVDWLMSGGQISS